MLLLNSGFLKMFASLVLNQKSLKNISSKGHQIISLHVSNQPWTEYKYCHISVQQMYNIY